MSEGSKYVNCSMLKWNNGFQRFLRPWLRCSLRTGTLAATRFLASAIAVKAAIPARPAAATKIAVILSISLSCTALKLDNHEFPRVWTSRHCVKEPQAYPLGRFGRIDQYLQPSDLWW